ncbi:hypothetical protein ACFQ78_10995 [Streptomyces sp. NPDC056519]|uniref:hypothetical protein n=1 Tax=Streptomyces sp. NPDC056519 TaxID=3345849 RepID=UPI0036C44187
MSHISATRTPNATVGIGPPPTALPVLSAEERGSSCIYCFETKETFVEPPARYTEDAAGARH